MDYDDTARIEREVRVGGALAALHNGEDLTKLDRA